MGALLSRPLDNNLKKNQEFMLETQKVQLERQIQMQAQMHQRMAALQIARARELFYWWLAFYGTVAVAVTAGYRRTKNPFTFAPMLPLTFIVGYQGDMAYGNKLHRIKNEAENIIAHEELLLTLPNGLPSFQSIEHAREEQNQDENLRVSHDIFL